MNRFNFCFKRAPNSSNIFCSTYSCFTWLVDLLIVTIMCIRITFVFVGCNKGKVGPALSTSHQNPLLVTPDNLRVSETYRCEWDIPMWMRRTDVSETYRCEWDLPMWVRRIDVSETFQCEWAVPMGVRHTDPTQREYYFISTAGDNPPWDTNSLLAGAGIWDRFQAFWWEFGISKWRIWGH